MEKNHDFRIGSGSESPDHLPVNQSEVNKMEVCLTRRDYEILSPN